MTHKLRDVEDKLKEEKEHLLRERRENADQLKILKSEIKNLTDKLARFSMTSLHTHTHTHSLTNLHAMFTIQCILFFSDPRKMYSERIRRKLTPLPINSRKCGYLYVDFVTSLIFYRC